MQKSTQPVEEIFEEYGIFLHGGATAISMAFFLALFSAGDAINTSVPLKISAIMFCVSLVINANVFILVKLFPYKHVARDLLHVYRFKHYASAGLMLCLSAIMILMAHYGTILFITFGITSLFSFHLSLKYFAEISKKEEEDEDEENQSPQ